MKRIESCILLGAGLLGAMTIATAAEPSSSHLCMGVAGFHEAWIKVGERACLKCHHDGGDASESRFLLREVSKVPMEKRASVLIQNCSAFTRMALEKDVDGQSRLLSKAAGGLDHGGGEVLKPDSTAFRVLKDFVGSLGRKPASPSGGSQPLDDDLGSFFDGVEMISDQRLLRRITLSLASRLPRDDERQVIEAGGLNALQPILVQLMTLSTSGCWKALTTSF